MKLSSPLHPEPTTDGLATRSDGEAFAPGLLERAVELSRGKARGVTVLRGRRPGGGWSAGASLRDIPGSP